MLLVGGVVSAADPIANKTKAAPPPLRMDARGFIDPWALRRDLQKLQSLPAGDQSCSVEEEDAEIPDSFPSPEAEHAYWQKRDARARRREQAERACESRQDALAKARKQALAELNRVWMPLLLRATEKNDPVAEVILRLCETAPLLDRASTASDCSPDPAQQALARQRLEAIGFQPALHNYLEAHGGEVLREAKQLCGDRLNEDEAQRCVRIQLEQEAKQLVALKAGILWTLSPWDTVCPYSDKRPAVQAAVETCSRALHINQAIAVMARRFYSAFNDESQLSLLRDTRQPFRYSGSAWPYERLLPLRDDDNDKDLPDDYQEQFYGEVYRAVRELEANIEADLRREPRWKVFLLERETEHPDGHDAVSKYSGTYLGPMISQGTSSVITQLEPGGDSVIGRYLMIYGEGEKVALGRLSPCLARPKNNLLCQWTDKFGHGFVNFSFDACGQAFKGTWMPGSMDRFPPMGPFEGLTDWDGKRQ